MKTMILTSLVITNATIVWSLIALFLVAAFSIRAIDDIKTVKKMDQSFKKKTTIRPLDANKENPKAA